MRYPSIEPGRFLSRPNRFVALVERDGTVETCHVKNTGRCRELLLPGARVYLSPAQAPGRKTAWDLVAVEKEGLGIVNIDAQAPNRAALEWLSSGGLDAPPVAVRGECRFGASRLDFLVESAAGPRYVEVKGVTLEQDGAALFPDAPTERGVRHLRELCACRTQGILAAVLFVIQFQGARVFRPNWAAHPAFGAALAESRRQGVEVLARCCRVTPDSMTLAEPVPVDLSGG